MSETICDRLLDLVAELGLPRNMVESIHADFDALTVTTYDNDSDGNPYLEMSVDGVWVPFVRGSDPGDGKLRHAMTAHSFPLRAPIADVREMSAV